MKWVTAIVFLAIAAPAGAAEVSLSGGILRYAAAPGETNRLSIEYGFQPDTQPSQDLVQATFTDPGATVAGCDPGVDEHTAICREQLPFRYTTVLLGDGDDTLASSGTTAVHVNAGPGDDTIASSESTDEFRCGPGADVVVSPDAGEPLIGCETVRFGELDIATQPVVHGDRVRFECGGCDGRVVLREAAGRERVLGRGRLKGGARLNDLGKRLLGRPRGVAVTVAVDGKHRWSVQLS